jgi:VCBS repeat-containing protein
VYDLADLPIPAGFVGVVEAVADQSISGQTWFGLQRGDVDGQDLVFASLPAFFVARYQYEVASSDVITVNIAAELHMDMMVALVDENDDVLTLQNLQPPGEAEILLNFSLPISGTYDIWVFEVGGNAGNFSLILQGQYDYEFVFKGTLAVPETTTNVLPAQQDDFWHFAGTVSQTITITVTPNDGSDLFFELYSTEGKIGDTVDDNGNGSSEQMVYVLPPTGFFAIRLGEFDFLPASYTIAVE